MHAGAGAAEAGALDAISPLPMSSIYMRIRRRARQIAARFPPPDFYQDQRTACQFSEKFFKSDAVIKKLRQYVTDHLEDDFGHGMQHVIKVAIDAGALMYIETEADDLDPGQLARRLCIIQSAGLLHDFKRKQKNHARLAAENAKKILQHYPFSPAEIEDICRAIASHEAFKHRTTASTSAGRLAAGCLYDADKFRWGPDNFTDTLWEMVAYLNPPLDKFMARYPRGMRGLARIKSTFRTRTGQKYGPQFIDLGIAIGEELFKVIQTDFAQYL